MRALQIFGIYTTAQINLGVLIYVAVNSIGGLEFLWIVIGTAFNSWIVSNQICRLTSGVADTTENTVVSKR